MNCHRKSVLAFPWSLVFPLRRGTCAVRTWNCSFCATWAPLVDPVCFLSHHVLLQEPPRCLATPRGASQYAGVPNPTRVLNDTTDGFSELKLVWIVWSCFTHVRALMEYGRGSRIPSTNGFPFCSVVLELQVGSCWLIFHTFFVCSESQPFFFLIRNCMLSSGSYA